MSEIKVFADPALAEERKKSIFLRNLIDDFKLHKQGILIHYFGREASYERPKSILTPA